MKAIHFSPRSREAILFGFITLMLMALPCSMALDGGGLLVLCEYTTITYAALIWLILLRRPATPTDGDLKVLQWAPLPLFFFGSIFYPFVWYMRTSHS